MEFLSRDDSTDLASETLASSPSFSFFADDITTLLPDRTLFSTSIALWFRVDQHVTALMEQESELCLWRAPGVDEDRRRVLDPIRSRLAAEPDSDPASVTPCDHALEALDGSLRSRVTFPPQANVER